MFDFRHRALCLGLALLLPVSALFAQKGGKSGSVSPSPSTNPAPDNNPKYDSSEFDPYRINHPDLSRLELRNEEPSCFKWPMSPVVSSMVSVRRLDLPARARDAFEQACAAVQKKKLDEAEKHLNQALKLHPKFAAAWVLLGQVQEDQQLAEKAE
jgi:tetratricopeptide (TPR) repeat protein